MRLDEFDAGGLESFDAPAEVPEVEIDVVGDEGIVGVPGLFGAVVFALQLPLELVQAAGQAP